MCRPKTSVMYGRRLHNIPRIYTWKWWCLTRGDFDLDGQADFFAEPFMAVDADVTLADIPLADLAPLTAQRQMNLSQDSYLQKAKLKSPQRCSGLN